MSYLSLAKNYGSRLADLVLSEDRDCFDILRDKVIASRTGERLAYRVSQ